MDRNNGTGSHPQDAIMVTKCVTIRDFASEDSSEPPQKWVNCFNVTSPMRQALCNPSDWESADTSHVLLHIDVPNQQPYHLPMLITPTLCVYLITFDLRYQKESLARIHSVMKNVYTLSTFATAGGGMEYPPVVLLVGTHADKVKAEDRGCFMQELNRRLEKMPYNRVVKRCGDEPFWAVDGGNLCLSDSHPLLQHIKCYGSEKGVEVRQWIMYHHELQEKLKASPCILFNELKKELDNVKSLKFDEFLQFLHNYGFIFYRSVEEGEEGDEGKVVLLQPEYLCKLFAKVQELSKSKNRFTVADLLSRTASYTRASAKYRQWFQRICIDMGLVVEVAQSDYVFLMGLEAGPSSPDRDLYSVPPLLVTCKDLAREAVEGECLLPSHFFAAFVTEFLRCPTLTESSRQQKPKQPKFEIMEQHYMQVSIGSTYIHVVEREFCIEIGLQQVEVRGRSTSSEKMLKSLQSFCMRIRKAVTDSADNILRRLKLTQSSLCYGFYHSRKTEDGPLAAFGEYTYMPFEDEPILECSCCDPGVNPTIPLQEIWFEEDFTFKEVSIEMVRDLEGREVRQLCVVLQGTPSSSDQADGQSNIASMPSSPCAPDGTTPQPKQAEPDLADQMPISGPTALMPLDQVLGYFRDRFIREADTSAIVFDLESKGIIPNGVLTAVNEKRDATIQNQILYAHLEKTSTKDSLITVCEVIIAVPGNPKMKALGEDMKSKLPCPPGGASSK